MWPTPVAKDDGKTPEAHMAMKKRMPGGPRKTITSLTVMVKAISKGKYPDLWPTPAVTDAERGYDENTARKKLRGEKRASGASIGSHLKHEPRLLEDRKNIPSGQINPEWVGWLMGYPQGWTDLEPSETP